MVVELVAGELDRVHERIAGRFGRAEPRARVREYVSGLVAGLERKNGWTLAEHAGEVSPDGMQRLLRRADWDVDGVRDAAVGPILAAHGAENIVIDRDSELLEGSAGQVTVVLRFATKAAAQAWYESPEYRAIKHLRTDNTQGTAVVSEGK